MLNLYGMKDKVCGTHSQGVVTRHGYDCLAGCLWVVQVAVTADTQA